MTIIEGLEGKGNYQFDEQTAGWAMGASWSAAL